MRIAAPWCIGFGNINRAFSGPIQLRQCAIINLRPVTGENRRVRHVFGTWREKGKPYDEEEDQE